MRGPEETARTPADGRQASVFRPRLRECTSSTSISSRREPTRGLVSGLNISYDGLERSLAGQVKFAGPINAGSPRVDAMFDTALLRAAVRSAEVISQKHEWNSQDSERKIFSAAERAKKAWRNDRRFEYKYPGLVCGM